MGVVGRTIISGLIGIFGLIALYFAANAKDGGIYYGGLLIFVMAVVYIFYQLKRGLDEAERGQGQGEGHA
ncbi:hypothetical protein [Ferruginivarius sediminum]|uniref:Uncharacterized protein n=1 Tax=Ferruginivarius sediminum TaxID=2661937 RepID=A0A369T535_9PROT|nr:hypothetical protein [Ferruginivarius sediminum]RDD60358.1 hypothetical protein DRB17_18530 [Ferruginivarius sediminum]